MYNLNPAGNEYNGLSYKKMDFLILYGTEFSSPTIGQIGQIGQTCRGIAASDSSDSSDKIIAPAQGVSQNRLTAVLLFRSASCSLSCRWAASRYAHAADSLPGRSAVGCASGLAPPQLKDLDLSDY